MNTIKLSERYSEYMMTTKHITQFDDIRENKLRWLVVKPVGYFLCSNQFTSGLQYVEFRIIYLNTADLLKRIKYKVPNLWLL